MRRAVAEVSRRAQHIRHRAVRVVEWAARLVGLLAVLSLVSPLLRRRLQPTSWLPLPTPAVLTTTAASVVVAASGVGLMLLATGLRRRKRRAWQMTVTLCALIVVSHPVGRHPLLPLVVAAVLL